MLNLHFVESFKSNIRDLNILHTAFGFVMGLVGIFIPIYLLEKGFSLPLIIAYLIFHPLLSILTSYATFRIMRITGLKRLFILSTILRIGFLSILAFSQNISWGFIASISILHSVADSTYWMPFHVEMTRSSDKNKVGKQVGTIQTLSRVASIVAPLLGGLIITYISYSATFVLGGIIIILASIPMMFSKDMKPPFHLKKNYLIRKQDEKLEQGYLFWGLWDVGFKKTWPLLFFIIIADTASIGGMYTWSNLLNAASVYLCGHFVTHNNKAVMSYVGTIGHGISGVLRVFATSINPIIILQGLGGIFGPLARIPQQREFYNKARETQDASPLFMREFYMNVGRATQAMVMLCLVLLLPIKTGLMISVILSSMCMQGLNIVFLRDKTPLKKKLN